MIIRPVALSDLAALQQIAVESGPGFTSLVDDRDFLTQKIRHSMDSFNRHTGTPGDEGKTRKPAKSWVPPVLKPL